MDQSALATPGDAKALGNFDVLIADEGNNRLLVVSPQKKILWTYTFHGTREGGDDAFFTDHGKQVITNLEHSDFIEKIDVAQHKPVWQYGHLGYPGWKNQKLYYPDDAYQMPDGNVIVADIRNCRIIMIAPDKHIVDQAGRTRDCSGTAGTLRSPNGDTPLSNGDFLVSEIDNHTLAELGPDWKKKWAIQLPILYPSDPQPTADGNVVVAGYTNPGAIIIINKDGTVLWKYQAVNGGPLNHPSLAEELPNGNIIANDDDNHRVIVIDPKTNRILWQYGVTGVAGSAHGYLHRPDGLDIIPASDTVAAPSPAKAIARVSEKGAGTTASAHTDPSPSAAPVHSVGAVTWHAKHFAGQVVKIRGYLLRHRKGYILFSDEPTGAVSRHDLPVIGPASTASRTDNATCCRAGL